MTDSWLPKRSFLFSLLIAVSCLFLFISCTCGDGSSGDNGAGDDDLMVDDDDDSTVDDDVDDDSSTTTTSVPATTTTTSPSSTSTTTTTVVTTTSTSTTTTTIDPGSGTACDPYNAVPDIVVPAVPYGPWPEWERDGVTFQQIVSSGAGFGQNDIAVSSDGVIHAVGQDGLSLDHYMIDAAGEITRDTINPLGGEWKVMDIDAEDHLHVVYTYRREPDEEVNELRYATNKSGEWVDMLLREVDRGEPDFDMVVDAAGVVHLVYSGVDRYDASMYYATWDGATLTETQLATDDTTWRYGCYIALDAASEPHIIATDDFGLFAWDLDDADAWVKTLIDADQASWDFGFDEQGRRHIVSNGLTDGDLYHGVFENDVWTWEDVDDCRDGIIHPKLHIDATGALHIAYTDGNTSDVYYATNKTGTWVFTHLRHNVGTDANDMSSTVDQDGHVHVIHRRDLAYSRLYYSTNRFGTWRVTSIGGTHDINSESSEGIFLKDDVLHFALIRDHYRRIVYGKLEDGVWSESEVYSTPTTGLPVGQEVSIEVGSNDIPQIVWANQEYEQLVHSRLIGNAWVNEIIDSGTSFSKTRLVLGLDDEPMLVYDGVNTGAKFATRAGDSWQVETLTFAGRTDDIGIDLDDDPVIVYRSSNGLEMAMRISSGNWVTEFITDENVGAAKLLIDLDGSSYIFHGGGGAGSYSTDSGGEWETELLDYPLPYKAAIVDDVGIPRVVVMVENSYAEWNGIGGIIYGAKINHEWKWHPIFMFAISNAAPQFLGRLNNGNFISVFDIHNTETHNGVFSAKFSPSIIDE